jgi:hypothetical protein
MYGCKPSFVKGQMENRDIAESKEHLAGLRYRIEVQQSQDSGTAIASSRTPNGIYLWVQEGLHQVGSAILVFTGQVVISVQSVRAKGYSIPCFFEQPSPLN